MSEILQSSARSFGVPMLFASLDPAVQAQLREGTRLRRFADGQLIQQRGEEPDGFWLIEAGSVAVGQFLPEGEFRAVGLLGPGDSYGELAVFARRPRVVDAVSRGPSSARYIRVSDFEAALAANPAAMRQLLGALAAQLQELLDLLAGIRRGTAAARLAGTLANLAGEADGPVTIRITQQELAELLGLTRPTVNAALREMESMGLLVRGYRSVTVPDPAALGEIRLG